MEEEVEEISITPLEALRAWRDALGVEDTIEDAQAMTTPELCRYFHVGKGKMRKMLAQAMETGAVEKVRVRRVSSTGKMYVVTAYRLTGELTERG